MSVKIDLYLDHKMAQNLNEKILSEKILEKKVKKFQQKNNKDQNKAFQSSFKI